MRFTPFAVILMLCLVQPLSNGQTLPASSPLNTNTLPDGAPRNAPVVVVRPELAHPNPEASHKQLLADLQNLITEAQALQQELQNAPHDTVSAQSFKRSQKIENLSKKLRKTLKAN